MSIISGVATLIRSARVSQRGRPTAGAGPIVDKTSGGIASATATGWTGWVACVPIAFAMTSRATPAWTMLPAKWALSM